MSISTTEEIIVAISSGCMVVLVDEEDRENEGDLLLAADFVTPEAINFMIKHARGLVCLALTEEYCNRLNLGVMSDRNGSAFGTNFMTSIEAADGVTTGISTADRSHTIRVAVADDTKACDIVQPGHIFPIKAVKGGVLMRAGHTEAGCDLTKIAGLKPAAVICEILKEDGTMARLPDLLEFSDKHNLKIGTISDLIHYRTRRENIVQRLAERITCSIHGTFKTVAYLDKPSGGIHLALLHGDTPSPDVETLVRVHQPASILDFLEVEVTDHSWDIYSAFTAIVASPCGVIVLLNCEESADRIIAKFSNLEIPSGIKNSSPQGNFRTYVIGAQILKDLGVGKMRLLANPQQTPSMLGYGLETVGYQRKL